MADNTYPVNRAYVQYHYELYLKKRFGLNACAAVQDPLMLENDKFIIDNSCNGRLAQWGQDVTMPAGVPSGLPLPVPVPVPVIPPVIPVVPVVVLTSYIAGENIGSGRLVYINTNKVYLYNGNDVTLADKAIGFSKGAALAGAVVNIQTDGTFTEVGFGLISGESYFAASLGLVSLVPASVCTLIGVAMTTDSIKIEIQQSIITL